MKKQLHTIIILLAGAGMISCKKYTNAEDATGGSLPGYFISVEDSSFNPNTLTVVSGTSVRFVNNTQIARSIISSDSTTVKLVSIAPNSSFLFNRDTIGSFYIRMADRPAAAMRLTLTP